MFPLLCTITSVLAIAVTGEEKCCEGKHHGYRHMYEISHLPTIIARLGACPTEGDAKFYSIAQVNSRMKLTECIA